MLNLESCSISWLPLLLPETLVGHGPKTVDQVMIEVVGHSFHVSNFPLLVCKVFIRPYVSPVLSQFCRLQSFQALLASHATYRKFSEEFDELKANPLSL